MLNKQVFKEQIEELIMFFPNWSVDVESKATMVAWYKKFEKYDDEEFVAAVNKYVSSESYQPTVSGLIKKLEENKRSGVPKCESILPERDDDPWF